MANVLSRIRKPVERDRASRYLLYTLLSFAASISFTRLFLELTGYPQLGSSTLHIAHVLWGGLLLFLGAITPIIWVNRWALVVDSILAGVGAGLFMDEVGKFITRSNDYFYPPAAPIIYVFFLLTVLIYLELRRPHKRTIREDLYDVFEDLQEVLDQDLSPAERSHILQKLSQVEDASNNPDFAKLIHQIYTFLNTETLYLVPHQPTIIDKIQSKINQFETRWIHKRREIQIGLAMALVAMGIWTLSYPIIVLVDIYDPASLQRTLATLVQAGTIMGKASLFWFEARLGLQVAVGFILLISAGLLAFKVDRLGIALSYLGMLLSLTTVSLLMFYFDQFSTIISAFFQFVVLIAVIYYRNRFLKGTNLPIT